MSISYVFEFYILSNKLPAIVCVFAILSTLLPSCARVEQLPLPATVCLFQPYLLSYLPGSPFQRLPLPATGCLFTMLRTMSPFWVGVQRLLLPATMFLYTTLSTMLPSWTGNQRLPLSVTVYLFPTLSVTLLDRCPATSSSSRPCVFFHHYLICYPPGPVSSNFLFCRPAVLCFLKCTAYSTFQAALDVDGRCCTVANSWRLHALGTPT